jgi:hypothetical protein
VGRSDEAEIDAQVLAPTDPGEGFLLDDAKQPGLYGQGNIANFIQEERPAVGSLDMAGPCEKRAGKCSLFMPEATVLGSEDKIGIF